jgi:hypothetical protein
MIDRNEIPVDVQNSKILDGVNATHITEIITTPKISRSGSVITTEYRLKYDDDYVD